MVYEKAGIELHPGKEGLVAARLGKRMREIGCRSYEAFLERAFTDSTGDGLADLIDALTTNFTAFLREPPHFEFMRREVLPALASRARINIWCAAAATGEEPYSIAFTLLDTFGPGAAARCRILATDISTRALSRARKKVYPAERFAGVPGHWPSKYLQKEEGLWRVRPEVARMVDFRKLNLIEPIAHGIPAAGGFPLIWCRNVMIYFDTQTQQRVVSGLERSLEPGGYLFVGHSESLGMLWHGLEYVRPAIYRRPG